MEVNVDVSYDGDRNLSELINKSEPGSNGSNKNAILVFLFLTSSFFYLLIKQKPDVRVKIILLAFFFLSWKLCKTSSTCHTLSWDQCLQPITFFHFFLPMNWSINLSPCILLISTRNQFFCQFHSLCIVIVTRIIDYYCYFQVI